MLVDSMQCIDIINLIRLMNSNHQTHMPQNNLHYMKEQTVTALICLRLSFEDVEIQLRMHYARHALMCYC